MRKHPLPPHCSQFRVSISSWYSRHFTACCHLSCSHLILPAKTYLVYPPLGTHLNCRFPSTCSSRPASPPSDPPTPSWALCFGTCCLALLNAVCVLSLFFRLPARGRALRSWAACSVLHWVRPRESSAEWLCPTGRPLVQHCLLVDPTHATADRWSSGDRKLPTPREGPLHYRAVLMVRKVLLSA